MRCSCQLVASAVVSVSLLANSSAVLAAGSATQPAAGNAWLALSMLTPSGATGLGGAAVAAAQSEKPPLPPPGYRGSSTPPLPVIAVWLAVLAADIYILTRHHHHHANSPG
ncbi:MAG TPA: hypothetical protein VK192_06570 [Sphingomicrobium sp.]|jgi:hypothetical protein|nr:hypothetical protein [Sphingomicrobium sp.]